MGTARASRAVLGALAEHPSPAPATESPSQLRPSALSTFDCIAHPAMVGHAFVRSHDSHPAHSVPFGSDFPNRLRAVFTSNFLGRVFKMAFAQIWSRSTLRRGARSEHIRRK